MGRSSSLQFEDKDIIVFSQFDGMNTQSNRHDLDEKKAAWMENLQPVGNNNLLSVPAANAAIATLTGEIISEQFFAPINGINYQICFCESGAAYAVNLSTNAVTKFANATTFSPSSADMTVWNLNRILIADPVAGYCTWDGTLFVQYGGVSPNITVTDGGSGYTGGATVAISGGSGSGATATATVVAGVVTAIVLTDAGTGYLAGDTLTVTITAVSGGSGATAIAHPWPNITPAPVTIAVFQGRVFLAAKNVLTYTGTGASYGGIGYDDFASGDAAGSFTITDADLITRITALRSLNNYLFVFGDNSVKQIGNLTVSSNTTNFTIDTLSSDQGTIYKNTIVSYNRLLLFANTVGVYGVYGTSVQKLSDDMDGIFRLIDFTQIPSAALNDINNIHTYLLLVKYEDPVKGSRSIILALMGKKWFVISQGDSISCIATAIIGGITEAFASSGTDVTQLLEDSQGMVDITLQTSLTSHQKPFISKRTGRFAVSQTAAANNTLTLLLESERSNESITYTVGNGLQFINDAGNDINFIGAGNVPINFFTGSVFAYAPGNSQGTGGIYLGATLTGSVISFILNSILIEFGEGGAFANTGVMVGGM